MKLAHFFINRPIFAAVIWTIVVIVGAIAFKTLPVSQYPEIAPPTIQVTATYPGASAETVADTVAAPLEEEINGVENMLYISSQSTAQGVATITVTFKAGTDLDIAQVLVQNRVSLAEPRLPEPVRRLGVSTVKANPDALLVVHLYSPDRSRDQLYISNYARLQMRDRLQRIEGVGQIRMVGLRELAMRIWIDPERAAAFNLTGADIVNALRGQNVEVSSGALDSPPDDKQGAFEVNVQTQGRLTTTEQFQEVIVKSAADGRQVRLKDVARVELGARDYTTTAKLDQYPALAMLFNQQPGSNALATAERILSTVKTMSKDFPQGLAYDVIWNPTQFVAQSIHEVEKTIFEAILLVSIVVFVFLQSVRAAIIPIVAIPISLIGTFAIMAALGYTINTLSLFGVVLAIGVVVDDAIVVVENIERKIHDGLSPKNAAFATMNEVGGALISIALVLSAVFIPTAFLEGISGAFYRQFAVTVASATVISAAVSLTLSPALASLLLKPRRNVAEMKTWERPLAWFFTKFDKGFDITSNGYASVVRRATRMIGAVLAVYAGLIALGGFAFVTTPKGFIPAVDQNYAITVIQLPPGASLARTQEVVNRVIKDGLANRHIAHAASFAGLDAATFTNASNAAAIFFTMTDLETRTKHGFDNIAVINELRKTFGAYRDARVLVIPPPPVRGVGNAGGFKGYVQDRAGLGYKALQAQTFALAGAANGQKETTSVFSIFNADTPQLYVNIDRTRAEMLGVKVDDVFDTLQVYLGSAYVNDFTAFGRPFQVTAQAEDAFRKTPEDIARLKTRNADGKMAPLGSVATFENVTGPARVARYNLFPAAELQGDTTPGHSSGQALHRIDALAKSQLQPGFGFEWTELALQEKLAGNTAGIALTLAVVFVFLLLAAQYESVSLPLAVILIVPMSLIAAITGVILKGLDVNILVQIGFVILIGLAAKNAILIVEFAKQQEDAGKSVRDAAIEAARLRLRPIVMTSFAFILGVAPLMIGLGAGYEMRQSLGVTVFAGMIGVTLFGLVFTPAFYVAVRNAGASIRARVAHAPANAAAAPAE